MIEVIQHIGKVVQEIEGSMSLTDLSLKQEKKFDNVILVDMDCSNNKFSVDLLDFYPEVFKESLIFLQARLHLGSGIKIENYVEEKKLVDKLLEDINKCLSFLEISNKLAKEILDEILNIIRKNSSQTYIISIRKNHQTAIELYTDKFEDKIENTYFKKKTTTGYCHSCNAFDIQYETAIYKCYNNDKVIYSNTEGYSFFICRNCLIDILYGRKHINQYLTTYWFGSEVMFLPNDYNEDIYDIYTSYHIAEDKKLLEIIRENEQLVLEELGKQSSSVDIIFYNDPKGKQEWKIEYAIKGVMPSRFTLVGNLLSKYKNQYSGSALTLWEVINTIGISGEGQEPKRLLTAIFKGYSLPRTQIFNRMLQKYKKDFIEGKKHLTRYHRIYNFLCEVGCLQNSWIMVKKNEGGWIGMEYHSVEEFFDKNSEFFNTEKKKAWFLLGRTFSSIIYYAKEYSGSEGTTHLEKSFFYSRKFDEKTFVLLANKCSEAIFKYGISAAGYIKRQISEAKALLGGDDSSLSFDEAKYIFFWGMDQFINTKGE